MTHSVKEFKKWSIFNWSLIAAVAFFLDCMSSFHIRVIIFETNYSGFWEFKSTLHVFFLYLFLHTRGADLGISDNETEWENKIQIIRPLGIKVQHPGFRTGHSLEKACYLEQGYGCNKHSEVYLVLMTCVEWLWSLYLIITFKWSGVFWTWRSAPQTWVLPWEWQAAIRIWKWATLQDFYSLFLWVV